MGCAIGEITFIVLEIDYDLTLDAGIAGGVDVGCCSICFCYAGRHSRG